MDKQKIVTNSAPTLGMGLGYFAVIWGIANGYLEERHHAEAVAMAGVVLTHLIMEFRKIASFLVKIATLKWNRKHEKCDHETL